MRPRQQTARNRLETVLTRQGPLSAPELAHALEVSGPTLLRMLKERGEALIVAGHARRRRYAWRRPLRGDLRPLVLYAIDEAGKAFEQGELTLKHPQGTHCLLDPGVWPCPPESLDGWWEGLPYPLLDSRPQGYMGRQFAHAFHRQLGLGDDPQAWLDDDVLFALSQHGHDQGGNLIVGDAALAHWQRQRLAGLDVIDEACAGERYAMLATQAASQGIAGSSAAGEFPKFTASRAWPGAATPHVIVKFSGADDSPAVRRWSDLLVCEHLALETLREQLGLSAARSRVLQHGGRTFLESERFDRHGLWGRSPLVSLASLDGALIGASSQDWPGLARRLHGLKLLAAPQVQDIALQWWFGRLIGNTDMHTGNLSFRPRGSAFDLAPAYDMLPMAYAPLRGGEVPERPFEPPLALPAEQATWARACQAALDFWARVQADARVSAAFKAVAAAHAAQLAHARYTLG